MLKPHHFKKFFTCANMLHADKVDSFSNTPASLHFLQVLPRAVTRAYLVISLILLESALRIVSLLLLLITLACIHNFFDGRHIEVN
jgi:hypothetical protein